MIVEEEQKEETICETCPNIERELFGLWCPILRKRISAINLRNRDIACSQARRRESVERYKIKRREKYPSLYSVHVALGAMYNSRTDEKRRKKKKFLGSATIKKRNDGSYKSFGELKNELCRLRNSAIMRCHPDRNPKGNATYYNAETAKINEAFERGLEIIDRRRRN